MPLDYARRLAGPRRSAVANRRLGATLAFVAGATNAGGFLAVNQYTSHMTGIVSSMAGGVALREYQMAGAGLVSLVSFAAGAAFTTIMVNYARRRRMHSEYASALLVEAVLLVVFSSVGAKLVSARFLLLPAAVMLLCFTMGLQNALITKLSNAEIRTTHITGLVTDIGIELGKFLYRKSGESDALPKVSADRKRLGILASLLLCFFAGGVAGALGFRRVGYAFTLPLAFILAALGAVPLIDDAAVSLRKLARK